MRDIDSAPNPTNGADLGGKLARHSFTNPPYVEIASA
jgi:hypothetical protein